jgi:hypothetical protein
MLPSSINNPADWLYEYTRDVTTLLTKLLDINYTCELDSSQPVITVYEDDLNAFELLTVKVSLTKGAFLDIQFVLGGRKTSKVLSSRSVPNDLATIIYNLIA